MKKVNVKVLLDKLDLHCLIEYYKQYLIEEIGRTHSFSNYTDKLKTIKENTRRLEKYLRISKQIKCRNK